MSTRVTRSSVAKSTAALLAVSKTEKLPQQSSSVPIRLAAEKKDKTTLPKKEASKAKLESSRAKKRTPVARNPNSTEKTKSSATITIANTGRKRKRAAPPTVEDDPNELPHNLGRLPIPSGSAISESGVLEPGEPVRKQRNARPTTTSEVSVETVEPSMIKADISEKTYEQATTTDGPESTPTKKPKRRAANPYGLTPGVTPFPDWPHPTIAECHEVDDLLSQLHGVQEAPKTIPKPSLTVSGCGEVPSILDAMIRTRLSAATTGSNSNMAMAGLVARFGILQEGIGKGSVDWDAVRRADVKDVFNAIKAGGLAEMKSADIKAILQMVYDENQARCEALLKAEQVDEDVAPAGAENETPAEISAEIVRAKEHVLSLDHLHALDDTEAMKALVRYPGIGVKTASCVMLFCMRRPSFAVDTHVFRLLKWLRWVPPEVKNEIDAFKHVEVKVPNELKYSLHQLFIKHGKTCGRCRAATGETSVDWDKGCVIDHLVTRTGPRKNGESARPAKKVLATPAGGKKVAVLSGKVSKVAVGKKASSKKRGGGDEEEVSQSKVAAGKKASPKKRGVETKKSSADGDGVSEFSHPLAKEE